MVNLAQVTQPGVSDLNGEPFSGLLVPSQATGGNAPGGFAPGGISLGPDANTDNYASLIVTPVQPNALGAQFAVGTADVSDTATIAAVAGQLNYFTGLWLFIQAYPTAAQAIRFVMAGIANTPSMELIVNSAGEIRPIPVWVPMLAIPATGGNVAISATLTHVGGGALSITGHFWLAGFSRGI